MAESDRTRVATTEHNHDIAAPEKRESADNDWRRGYDEAVRDGPPLDTSVAQGDYKPGFDTLVGAPVRGYAPPEDAEPWGRDYAAGESARPIAASEGDYAPTYNMPRHRPTPGGYGRIGGWSEGGTAAQAPRGPKNYRRSDDRIREDLCEHLMDIGHIDLSDVEVHVSDGCVKLEGTVPDRRMKYTIEDIAASTLGVRDIENNLRVPRQRIDEERNA